MTRDYTTIPKEHRRRTRQTANPVPDRKEQQIPQLHFQNPKAARVPQTAEQRVLVRTHALLAEIDLKRRLTVVDTKRR